VGAGVAKNAGRDAGPALVSGNPRFRRGSGARASERPRTTRRAGAPCDDRRSSRLDTRQKAAVRRPRRSLRLQHHGDLAGIWERSWRRYRAEGRIHWPAQIQRVGARWWRTPGGRGAGDAHARRDHNERSEEGENRRPTRTARPQSLRARNHTSTRETPQYSRSGWDRSASSSRDLLPRPLQILVFVDPGATGAATGSWWRDGQ